MKFSGGGELRLSAEPEEKAGWADGKDVPWAPAAGLSVSWVGGGPGKQPAWTWGSCMVPSMWLAPLWKEPFPGTETNPGGSPWTMPVLHFKNAGR